MCFEKFIQNKIAELVIIESDYTIVRNRKRGQSDTFTIYDHHNKPVYIAKFFDYLPNLKDVIGQKNIDYFTSLDKLLDKLDDIEDIQSPIDEVVHTVTFQQKCFKRYINVCNITDLGCFPAIIYSEDGVPINHSFYGFLIEEYMDGVTLENRLPIESEEIKSKITLQFLMQLGDIIRELNQNGIVHRDISPDNIIYLDGKYIVIDPGVVKFSDDNPPTQSRMTLGKHYYASPEQYFGNAKTVTFKSDLYAVGIIALEIILGYNPLKKVIIEEQKSHAPHKELLNKYNREIEDQFFDKIEDNEFNSKLLLIIKKMVQIEDRHRYDSIDSFIVALKSLEKRNE